MEAGAYPSNPSRNEGISDYKFGDVSYKDKLENAGASAANVVGQNTIIGQLHTTIRVGTSAAEAVRIQALRVTVAKEDIKNLADRIRVTFSLIRDLSDLLETIEADFKDEKLPVLQSLVEENRQCGKVFAMIQKKIETLKLKRYNKDDIVSKIQRMQAEIESRKGTLQLSLTVLSVSIQCRNSRKPPPKEMKDAIIDLQKDAEESKKKLQLLIHKPHRATNDGTNNWEKFSTSGHRSYTPGYPTPPLYSTRRQPDHLDDAFVPRKRPSFDRTESIYPRSFPHTSTNEDWSAQRDGTKPAAAEPSFEPWAGVPAQQPTQATSSSNNPITSPSNVFGPIASSSPRSFVPCYVGWELRKVKAEPPSSKGRRPKSSWKVFEKDLLQVCSEELYLEVASQRERDARKKRRLLHQYSDMKSGSQRSAIDSLISEQDALVKTHDSRIAWRIASLKCTTIRRSHRDTDTTAMTIVLKTELLPPHGTTCPCQLCRVSYSGASHAGQPISHTANLPQWQGRQTINPALSASQSFPGQSQQFATQFPGATSEGRPQYGQGAGAAPPPPPPPPQARRQAPLHMAPARFSSPGLYEFARPPPPPTQHVPSHEYKGKSRTHPSGTATSQSSKRPNHLSPLPSPWGRVGHGVTSNQTAQGSAVRPPQPPPPPPGGRGSHQAANVQSLPESNGMPPLRPLGQQVHHPIASNHRNQSLGKVMPGSFPLPVYGLQQGMRHGKAHSISHQQKKEQDSHHHWTDSDESSHDSSTASGLSSIIERLQVKSSGKSTSGRKGMNLRATVEDYDSGTSSDSWNSDSNATNNPAHARKTAKYQSTRNSKAAAPETTIQYRSPSLSNRHAPRLSIIPSSSHPTYGFASPAHASNASDELHQRITEQSKDQVIESLLAQWRPVVFSTVTLPDTQATQHSELRHTLANKRLPARTHKVGEMVNEKRRLQ